MHINAHEEKEKNDEEDDGRKKSCTSNNEERKARWKSICIELNFCLCDCGFCREYEARDTHNNAKYRYFLC